MPFFENEDSRKSRMEICLSCEHKKETPFGPQCGACHCMLNAKVFFKYAKCPIGKWETFGESRAE